jgi:radical SAM enzyme (rSAM/lipoprotein system)
MGIGIRKNLSLNAFRLQRKVQSGLHDLTYLFWECTLRCNLSCVHCGSDCTRDTGTPDMPVEDFLGVLDGVSATVDPGRVMVCLTGGEPTLRKDLEECGRAIHSRGFPWGFVTNGSNLDGARLRRLVADGLGSMTISLDGLRENHDWFRGRKGSFDSACDAIRLASGYGSLVFDVVTCVNRKNISELPGIRDILIELGAGRWRIFTVFPKGRAAGNEELSLDGKHFVNVMKFIASCRESGAIETSYGCEGFLGRWEGEVRDTFFHCRAGISIGSVLADGSISACPSLRGDFIQGNIYTDDFMSVWMQRFDVMRTRDWMKTDSCTSCRLWKWCEGSALHLRDEKTGKLSICHPEWLGELC